MARSRMTLRDRYNYYAEKPKSPTSNGLFTYPVIIRKTDGSSIKRLLQAADTGELEEKINEEYGDSWKEFYTGQVAG